MVTTLADRPPARRLEITSLAARYRLPAAYPYRIFVNSAAYYRTEMTYPTIFDAPQSTRIVS